MRGAIWVALIGGLLGCGGGGGGDDDDVDAGGSECSAANDTCTGGSICIGGSCEAAFGRVYEVTDVDVQLPTTDGNGEAWDFGGGAPDIFIEIIVNGASVANSTAVQDSFSASFAGPFSVQPVGGADLVIEVYDEDVSVNDLAYTCGATPITADLLRARQLECTSAGYLLSFTIEPR